MLEQWLNAWDRQAAAVNNIASLVDEDVRSAKPSADGWSLDFHLAHIHETRYYWLSTIGKERVEGLGDTFKQVGDEWVPIDDLDEIRNQLRLSEAAVRAVVAEASETTIGPYDNAMIFMTHMVWHEGWHAGLIMLGLRLAGREPSEEWEDPNVWGKFRNWG
jgi:uncharacterized damage-inducible protein DinB